MNKIEVIQSEAGKEIIVRVVHSRFNEDAWIGLFKAGSGDHEHGDRWKWMRDVDVSHITLPAQGAGEWSVRLFKDGGYDRISYLDFKIIYSGSIEILEAVSGKPVRFKINNRPSNNDAWVGIYPVNAGDNEHGNRWKWIRDIDVNNAMLPEQAKGRWSIRVFLDGGYTLHDRVDFDIVSAHNPNMPGTMPGQTMPGQHIHDPDKAAEFARALGLNVGGAGHPFVGNWQTKGFYAYRSGQYSGIAYFGSGGSEHERLAYPSESEKYRPWNRDDPKIPEDIRQKLITLEDRMNQTSQHSKNLSDGGGGLDGHYFSFKTGGNPNDIVDRFEARQDGNRVTYYRNGPVGSKSRVNSATANPMESYSISGSTLHGPVTGTIKPNGDIEYSHGYTSRKEGETTSSTSATHCKPGPRLTYADSEVYAAKMGGRLLTLDEAKALMGGRPLYPGEDQWCAVQGRDWVQVGDLYHHPGKSHNRECGGYPPWGDDANNSTYGNPSWNYVALYKIQHKGDRRILQTGWYRIENADGSLIERVRVHQDFPKTHQARNEFIATGDLTGDVMWYVEGNIVKVPKFGSTGTIQADGNITWDNGGKAIYEGNSAITSEPSETSSSSSPEIDIMAQFKSKLELSNSHLSRIDELSSKFKKK